MDSINLFVLLLHRDGVYMCICTEHCLSGISIEISFQSPLIWPLNGADATKSTLWLWTRSANLPFCCSATGMVRAKKYRFAEILPNSWICVLGLRPWGKGVAGKMVQLEKLNFEGFLLSLVPNSTTENALVQKLLYFSQSQQRVNSFWKWPLCSQHFTARVGEG